MVEHKIVGFFGSDKYEILLYLSRILCHLKKKVLLVDFSETKALTQSIPIPNILNESSTYLDYRGVDFIKGENYCASIGKDYDYVLIDFGFNREILSKIQCDNIIYVTDLQLHNVKRINILSKKGNPKQHVIIKDVLPCSITPEYVLLEINLGLDIEDIYIIEQDAIDIKFKIQSQYSQTFFFDKLSKSMKTFLQDILFKFDENLSKNQIINAYRKAERGK